MSGFMAKSCPTLCNPMDCSPPRSSVHGLFQAKMLDAIFSRDLPDPEIEPWSPACEIQKMQQTSEYNKKEADS